jgi:GH25 family lysozyme M1 (1,4-beta-N-acetylmuramidase)
MNKASKALWKRKLNYRLKRLHIAKKKKRAARISKWTKLVAEAKSKLSQKAAVKKPVPVKPVPAPVKKPDAKKPDVVLNHPTNKDVHKKGIDVYEGDGDIDWAKVKSDGYEYVFCKTSEGGDWKDPSWTKERVQAIRKAGLKLGVYHFLRPKPGRQGRDEMSFFIKQARSAGWGEPGDLRAVIDFEATELSSDKTVGYLMSAVEEVKTLTGKTPIMYTGGPFWDEKTNSYPKNLGCPLWLAAYVNNPDKYLPQAWSTSGWAIWQHTDRGPVKGISVSNVDQNIAKQLPTL